MSQDYTEEKNVQDIKPQTDVQLVQKIFYDLLSEKIFTLDGVDLQVEGELPEQFISKSLLIEKLLEVLNGLGEELVRHKNTRLEDAS